MKVIKKVLIFVAIIIIALLAHTFNNLSIFQKTKLTEEEQEQLIAFNEQYTKYVGQYVYGTDVITVINKSLDNKQYPITIQIQFVGEYSYTTKKWHINEYGHGEYEDETITINDGNELNLTNNEEYTGPTFIDSANSDLKNRAFKCTKVNYDSYGRINMIRFEEKMWNNVKIR